MKIVVGIDFDNTIADYDEMIFNIASEKGYVGRDVPENKKLIRDSVRLLPDGESKWMEMQGIIYGPRMGGAKPAKGVLEFLKWAKKVDLPIYVVSHKTQYAVCDETKTDLRKVAMGWMNGLGFFDEKGLGLKKENVYFEKNRVEKVGRISKLKCTHFIDDLEETFEEKLFPSGVGKVLYASEGGASSPGDWIAFDEWSKISDYFAGMQV